MATIKKSKIVKAAVPVAAAKAAKASTAAKAEVVVKASKYKGVTTGMRVMEYQDSTFAANGKKMLTDEELVADWRREFPEAVAFTVGHLAGARRDYNNGRHSKAYSRPETQLGAAVLVDGKRTWAADVTVTVEAKPVAKKAKAPKAEPVVAPVAAKPTAKGTAKAIRRMPKTA